MPRHILPCVMIFLVAVLDGPPLLAAARLEKARMT